MFLGTQSVRAQVSHAGEDAVAVPNSSATNESIRLSLLVPTDWRRMSFEDVQKRVVEFRDARDWAQFHNSKDLAISISLEAAELLESFQWSGEDLEPDEKLDNVTEELADVLIYCVLLADHLGVDPATIMLEKVSKNAEKYPVEKAKGSSRKYTEL